MKTTVTRNEENCYIVQRPDGRYVMVLVVDEFEEWECYQYYYVIDGKRFFRGGDYDSLCEVLNILAPLPDGRTWSTRYDRPTRFFFSEDVVYEAQLWAYAKPLDSTIARGTWKHVIDHKDDPHLHMLEAIAAIIDHYVIDNIA